LAPGLPPPAAKWNGLAKYEPRARPWFADPSHAAIGAGIATLAAVCRREFGAPARIANVQRALR
jgi:2-aminoadipate transaminase